VHPKAWEPKIARQLAAEGAAVVANYASSRSGADKVVADITSKGGRAPGNPGPMFPNPSI